MSPTSFVIINLDLKSENPSPLHGKMSKPEYRNNPSCDLRNLEKLILRDTIQIVLISFSRQEVAYCCTILFWYRAADLCRDLMNNDKDCRVGQLTRRKEEQSHKVEDNLASRNSCESKMIAIEKSDL